MTGESVTARGWVKPDQLATLHGAFQSAFGSTLGMSAIALADIGNPDLCDDAACQQALDALLGQYVTHMQGHLAEPRFKALAGRMGALTPADWLTLAGLAYYKGAYGALSWLDRQSGQSPIAAAHDELDRHKGRQHKIVETLDALTAPKDKSVLAAKPARTAADSVYAVPGELGAKGSALDLSQGDANVGAAGVKRELASSQTPSATASGLLNSAQMAELNRAMDIRYIQVEHPGWTVKALVDLGHMKRDKYEAALKAGQLKTIEAEKAFKADADNWDFEGMGLSGSPSDWEENGVQSLYRLGRSDHKATDELLGQYNQQVFDYWLKTPAYRALAERIGNISKSDRVTLVCLAYHYGAQGIVERLNKHQDPMAWAHKELKRISPEIASTVAGFSGVADLSVVKPSGSATSEVLGAASVNSEKEQPTVPYISATQAGLLPVERMKELYDAFWEKYGGDNSTGWTYKALVDIGELKQDKYNAAIKVGKLNTAKGRKDFDTNPDNWNFDVIGVSTVPEQWTERGFGSIGLDKEVISTDRLLGLYDIQIKRQLSMTQNRAIAARIQSLSSNDRLVLSCLAYHYGAQGILERVNRMFVSSGKDPMVLARSELQNISPHIARIVQSISSGGDALAGN